MSNTILPITQQALPEPANGQATGQAVSPQVPATGPGALQTDSVTLSATAQASTALLSSARNAQGMDHAAVAQIRAQLANGSYNVSPENLAQAIATVLKEAKQ
jgi:flagellar biosynthesis anti-sigma factor FlgM